MLAIKNGKILTISKGVIEKGTILIDKRKIVKIGKNIDIPSESRVIDASGKVVMPGMIDAHCHTGVFADGVGGGESDGNEMTNPVMPHLRAIDAINPEDMAFKDLREGGVTTINTGPGSGNVIGGQTAVIKTYGKIIEEMIIRAPGGMKMALGENPKRVYGGQKKTPSTRMGNAAILREWLVKASDYQNKWKRYEEKLSCYKGSREGIKRPEPPEKNLCLEELTLVLERKIPAHIHAHRADDILTALRIAKEFNINLVLIHATEGYKIADILAKKKVPCIVGPILFSRSKYELRGMTPRNPALLSKAGVKVALQTDEMSAVRYLLLNAALAVEQGMDENEALKAITLYPAQILGIEDRVGSLDAGKDADIIILSAYPLEVTKSHVEIVLINGEIVYERKTGNL